VWQSSLILLFLNSVLFATPSEKIIEANPSESSPREALRGNIFSAGKEKRVCKKLEITLKGDLAIDASLSAFIKKILDSLDEKKTNEKKAEELVKLFHERLKIRASAVSKSLQDMDNALGKPVQFTALELFALNSPDGNATGLHCAQDKDQDLTINPQFGYPLQFSLWIQATGQKELGRLHVGIVPDRSGAWKVGLWQHFQWTHDQKDFVEFAKMGEAFQKNGRPVAAYLHYDASEKLIRNLGYVEFEAHQEILKLKSQIMSQEKFSDLVKSTLKDPAIKMVVTNYIEGGLAVVIRVETKEEVSLQHIKDYCSAKAKLLKDSKDFKGGLTAIRCGFILPKEDPSKDGVLGSYLTKF